MSEADILLYYVLLMLGLAVGCYVLFRVRERSLRWELSRPRLGRCPRCNRVFLVKRQAPVARCPRCNEVCETYITD